MDNWRRLRIAVNTVHRKLVWYTPPLEYDTTDPAEQEALRLMARAGKVAIRMVGHRMWARRI